MVNLFLILASNQLVQNCLCNRKRVIPQLILIKGDQKEGKMMKAIRIRREKRVPAMNGYIKIKVEFLKSGHT